MATQTRPLTAICPPALRHGKRKALGHAWWLRSSGDEDLPFRRRQHRSHTADEFAGCRVSRAAGRYPPCECGPGDLATVTVPVVRPAAGRERLPDAAAQRSSRHPLSTAGEGYLTFAGMTCRLGPGCDLRQYIAVRVSRGVMPRGLADDETADGGRAPASGWCRGYPGYQDRHRRDARAHPGLGTLTEPRGRPLQAAPEVARSGRAIGQGRGSACPRY
jgi:hypothetical protein